MKRLKFTCMIATCTLFVISCKNPTGTGGTVSNISYGTYSAAVSQIWYADETTPRDFIDIATYNADGTTFGYGRHLVFPFGKEVPFLFQMRKVGGNGFSGVPPAFGFPLKNGI